jgi:hypothetical protein
MGRWGKILPAGEPAGRVPPTNSGGAGVVVADGLDARPWADQEATAEALRDGHEVWARTAACEALLAGPVPEPPHRALSSPLKPENICGG